jgi:hypothetical protein
LLAPSAILQRRGTQMRASLHCSCCPAMQCTHLVACEYLDVVVRWSILCCVAGAGFLPWMPSFTKWFGGLKPISLTASVLFFPPFIRDIACWAGFRQVCAAIHPHNSTVVGTVVGWEVAQLATREARPHGHDLVSRTSPLVWVCERLRFPPSLSSIPVAFFQVVPAGAALACG